MKLRKIITTAIMVCVVVGFSRCSEQPLIISKGEYRLNSPSSMVIIPGTDLAVVANANVNLDQVSGALIAVDLSTNELLLDTLFTIPNFAGDMYLDTTRHQIYIPNHDNALLVYAYSIPGTDGQPISFVPIDVPVPVDNDGEEIISNGVETDDAPSQAVMIAGTSLDDLIFVANQFGTVSMIQAENLKLVDKDDEKYFGLRLISSSNFENFDKFPGRGAARISVSPVTGLLYITSTLNNDIYVLDPDTQIIEAMITLDDIALPTVGTRDIAFDNLGKAYVAHSGLDSIVVLDVSGITKNGLPMEVLQPPVLDIIPVGDGPEDIEIDSLTGATLFVSNQNEDSVYMIDTATRQILKRTYLDAGKSPGRLVWDESRNTVYCLNFFSNSISLINDATGNFIEDIK